MDIRLADLAQAVGAELEQTPGDTMWVRGICEDSRQVVPGDLFVAVRGAEHDGAVFIPDAVRRGAAAVLSELGVRAAVPVLAVANPREAMATAAAMLYGHPTARLFTVGVTGTNGKTTTCHWIADLLGRDRSAVSSTVRHAENATCPLTTPSSPALQRLAWDAVQRGDEHLILEASSAGIAQGRVSAIDFDVCVFTNFSPEHRRHHGGVESYREAKMRLFRGLKPEGWAVLNADDPMHRQIAAETSGHVLTFGLSSDAMLRCEQVRSEARGTVLTVRPVCGGRADDLFLPFWGMYNVGNALAALAVGTVRDVAWTDLVDRLACVCPVPGRAEVLRHKDGRTAIVDFAHNPASLEAILGTVRNRYARVLLVFGCPGDGEHEKRVEMGQVSARWAHEVVLTADNPGTEDPMTIAEEIRSGIVDGALSVEIEADRRTAIAHAVARAGAQDVVLVAGKGHETVQRLQGRSVAHSDRDVLCDLGFFGAR